MHVFMRCDADSSRHSSEQNCDHLGGKDETPKMLGCTPMTLMGKRPRKKTIDMIDFGLGDARCSREEKGRWLLPITMASVAV